ncbi:GGDEF domain-containing protein [Vibrio sp. qd031]|uniref:transporter substrate-binding domain-containing diguanylate cyclase n=1 Tax=Vibrio sp. qd031 TaxID=1603038 RepID=UPI000A11D63B|nr:GGDEF domain-containing protein [Vibrio sp. qd031]
MNKLGWVRQLAVWILLVCAPVTFAAIEGRYVVATESDDVITKTLFDEVSEQLGLDIVYLEYPNFDALLKGVASGESDFAANITFTESRAADYNFSSPTNIEYTYLFTQYQSEFNWDKATKVAAPKNTIFVELIKERYPHVWVAEFDGVEQGQLWLSMSLVDAMIDAIHNLKPMLEEGYEAQLLNDQLPIKPVSIVAPKGQHQELLDAMVKVIHQPDVQRKLRENILAYQFEIRQKALQKQSQDLSESHSAPISIVIENLYPFARYLDNGNIEGISADTVLHACDLIGVECDIVSQAGDSWDDIYTAFKQGEVDAIAPLTISDSRKEFVHFTSPHYFPVAVLAKRSGYKHQVYGNVSELLIERIGVVKNDFFEELMNELLPQKQLYQYENQDELLKALLRQEIDYIALDRSKLNQWLVEDDKLGIEEELNIEPFHVSEIAMGFQKNPYGEQLAHLFSMAFRLIDTEQINALYDLTPDWRETLAREKEYASKFQMVLWFALVLAALTAWYMFRLSLTDTLTGLYNRRAMYLLYGRGLKAKQSLCYLDVNKFKQLNDTYGHHFGDRVLQQYSRHLKMQLPGRAFRIGGDEFVVVCRIPKEPLVELITSLKKFRVEIEGAKPLEIDVSVGLYIHEHVNWSFENILRMTDRAMYTAKKESDDQCVIVHGLQTKVA